MLNKVEECVALLKATERRLPEAAFLARTYLPSKVGEIVGEWKGRVEGQPRQGFRDGL